MTNKGGFWQLDAHTIIIILQSTCASYLLSMHVHKVVVTWN